MFACSSGSCLGLKYDVRRDAECSEHKWKFVLLKLSWVSGWRSDWCFPVWKMSLNFFGLEIALLALSGCNSVRDGGVGPLHGDSGEPSDGTFWSLLEAGDKESVVDL